MCVEKIISALTTLSSDTLFCVENNAIFQIIFSRKEENSWTPIADGANRRGKKAEFCCGLGYKPFTVLKDEGAPGFGALVCQLWKLQSHFAANLSVLGQLHSQKPLVDLQRDELFGQAGHMEKLARQTNSPTAVERKVSQQQKVLLITFSVRKKVVAMLLLKCKIIKIGALLYFRTE